ncbi:hypothetical protein [Bergeyella sp. RCAD1439]|uniref:hypothetical protein n=1 Tax=Bergeyella anatis TaxID=3113737 RepID=UPI002E17E957|nr:hypothetical protein [Bergeyella sp. RCAD1439]
MKKKTIFLYLPCLILLWHCEAPTPQKSAPAQPTNLSKSSLLWKGKLILGHETASFSPCGSTSAYWIIDESSTLDSLYAQANRNASSPYPETYCEVIAEEHPKAEEGFAADYDGTLKVKKVLKVAPWTSTNSCR